MLFALLFALLFVPLLTILLLTVLTRAFSRPTDAHWRYLIQCSVVAGLACVP